MSTDEQIKSIMPIGGKEPEHHHSRGCWCFPLEKDGLLIHNAKDCREAYERIHGRSRSFDEKWATIEGDLISLP